ncbi:hypothetical protein Val02_63060 [Virgisporangium aliadipatigenens]|uniref:Uncharacterized protein n=1 Tax=Virgisporangium aliadipatigenens TaxID=741659 RepID=A0A8J4DSN3_9ACTN|nr:hypothetical protein [Virgisporangium aliadipatigenens]GIJ49420.1 hypothetical protein Val02_63060 [Virgisporangium aliadipatigenens]
MTELSLPALDGRTPLGFLAALGILRLVTENRHPDAHLRWSPADCTAVLCNAQDNIDDLVADLNTVVEAIPADGVLPAMPIDLPPPGAAPDKMRLPRPELTALAARVWADAGEAGERWMASMVTDLSLDDQKRANISRYAAPSGKQSMRTMLEKPLSHIRTNPGVLREAILGWRRYPGVTGEYLDHRVLFDAADAPDGKPMERGVPGATWLALMAYPLLRTTATAGEATSTGWQRPPGRRTTHQLIYPLWSHPLDMHTIPTVLDHPILDSAQPGRPPDLAQVLSIFLICCAQRRRIPGRNFAGVLTPIRPPRATSN